MVSQRQIGQMIADSLRFRRRPSMTQFTDEVWFASIPLSGQRVVKAIDSREVTYPDTSSLDGGDAIVGVSLSAADTSEPIFIRTHGPIQDPSFAFDEGPVFCGPDGTLIQFVPEGPWMRQIGTALSSDTLFVDTLPTYFIGA